MTPVERRFWSKVNVGTPDVCWPWTGATTNGYGRFRFRERSAIAPRVAYLFATGKEPGDLAVCHHCDNPPCCNPSHLFLGNHLDNYRDMRAKGRDPTAKITEDEARRIKFGGEKGAHLARALGVTEVLVCHIRKGHTWKWLKPVNPARDPNTRTGAEAVAPDQASAHSRVRQT